MSISHLHEVQNFRPAVVRTFNSLGIVVEYYFYDPKADVWVRKRIRLQRVLSGIKGKRERLLAAQEIADRYNEKLRGGWSPLHESEDSRLYTPLPKLRERFLEAKEAEGCRASTLVQYGSVTDIFIRWCEDSGLATRCSGTFLRPDAVRYMDDVLAMKHRHKSYNNTLKVMKSFFAYAVEHCYAQSNPFESVKTLKNQEKLRVPVDADYRKVVTAYYDEHCPAMNIVCQLVYTSAIRPGEIANIRIRDIHIEEHYIVIPAASAKNGHERLAALSPALEVALSSVVYGAKSTDYYLFSRNADMTPGPLPVNKQHFQKSWARMRRLTGLPDKMQLYSLRDTGLSDLLKEGVDPLTVKQHADHHSLAMTDIYTSHRDPAVQRKIYDNAPEY